MEATLEIPLRYRVAAGDPRMLFVIGRNCRKEFRQPTILREAKIAPNRCRIAVLRGTIGFGSAL
jgi:hypothetical protein